MFLSGRHFCMNKMQSFASLILSPCHQSSIRPCALKDHIFLCLLWFLLFSSQDSPVLKLSPCCKAAFPPVAIYVNSLFSAANSLKRSCYLLTSLSDCQPSLLWVYVSPHPHPAFLPQALSGVGDSQCSPYSGLSCLLHCAIFLGPYFSGSCFSHPTLWLTRYIKKRNI